MIDDDISFIKVTRVYLANSSQAKQAVAMARVIHANTEYFSRDADGTRLTVRGNDYLESDGSPDVVSAFTDLPDPELLLGIECVESTGEMLTALEVAKLTEGWPVDWREQPDT